MGSYRGSLRIAATNDVIDGTFVVDDERLTINTGEDSLGSWPLSELAPDDTGTHVLLALDGERVVIDVPDHAAFVAALDSPGPKRKRRRRKPKRERKPKSEAKPKRERKPKPADPPEPDPQPEPARRPKPARPPEPEAEIRDTPPAPPDPEISSATHPEVESAEPAVGFMPEAEPRHRRRRTSRSRRKRDWKATLRNLVDRDTWEQRREDPVFWLILAVVGAAAVLALAVFATKSLGMILVLLGMVVLVIVALAVSEDLTAYSWIPGSISETTLIIAGVIALAIGGLLILIG